MDILSTLHEMSVFQNVFKKILDYFSSKENMNKWKEEDICRAYKELKSLLFTKFCIQMRDYSDLIFGLINEEKNKKLVLKQKYVSIVNFFNDKNNFLWHFLGENNSKNVYTSLSFIAHNLNEKYYGKEKTKKSYDKFKNFSDILNNLDIKKSHENLK